MNDLNTATQVISGLNGGNVPALDMIYTLTLVALLPTIVIMMTSFVRIIIILSFTRTALGVQQTPPNIVLIGISLFLTLFIMTPTMDKIRTQAIEPYQAGQITQEEAMQKMEVPMKEFMLRNTEKKTLNKFVSMAKQKKLDDPTQYPLTIITPAFMTNELKRGFMAGFLIYLPFLLIDVVVASTLMAMGMAMMPPTMVSMPFKLLLFVSVNGWDLMFSTIVNSFR
ncbi:MAG: flagellar type III secretion system pore protein FliP [Lachnospiraceae bacterium]|jgi:flagellar biosynthetic protein FliP|nr:flagellar type III secretion system pore protein FliP [Lachnospiraceae bacterium]